MPKRPTYQQNWAVNNLAQRQEKNRSLVLLADLCGGIADPPRQGSGRPPVPLRDRIFSLCFKVWSTLSSRRFDCDLQNARERGYLSRSLYRNKVNSFLESDEVTPYLRAEVDPIV